MVFILLLIVSLVIAYKDITERRVPNFSHYIILLIVYCQALTLGLPHKTVNDLLPPIMVLLTGAMLSRLSIIGFGDVKLLFTVFMVSPATNYLNILYFTLLTGGCWAIAWQYVISKIPFIRKIDQVGKGIPYAIPILTSLCLFSYATLP